MNNSPNPARRSSFWLPAYSLWWRDVIRFLRQKNRIISALATPLVFWLLLGAGFTASFQPPGADSNVSYLVYFFPGTVVLIMLFTAIFSTITVIEDRREGILQGWLVTPAKPSSLVFGKFTAGMTLAVFQGLLFCALAPVVGIPLGPQNILPVLLSFVLTGFAMTGMGFIFAWPLDSTAGFHALMNIFLMPLWMMSGALFPVPAGSGWLWWIYLCNPVTYCVESVRQAMSADPFGASSSFPNLGTSLAVTAAFAGALFVISCLMARRPRVSKSN